MTDPSKFLRVGYIRILIYMVDYRKRKLGSAGLIPELICSVEFKRLKRIRTIDIFGGKVELKGKDRIVWNRNWINFEQGG